MVLRKRLSQTFHAKKGTFLSNTNSIAHLSTHGTSWQENALMYNYKKKKSLILNTAVFQTIKSFNNYPSKME